LLDVVVAIEGPDEAFRCEQLLKRRPGADPKVDYRQACLISQAMRRADLAWRRELAQKTLLDLRADVERQYPATQRNILNGRDGAVGLAILIAIPSNTRSPTPCPSAAASPSPS
jgi:DNA-binding IscR family transcriptional regulator